MTDRVVLVFLKYPEPGKVKTRLARDLGGEEAARVYRRLAEEVLEAAMGFGEAADVKVWYDPPEREAEVTEWVSERVSRVGGGGGDAVRVRCRAQEGGDLGARLRGAFEEAFAAGYRRAIAVGTDCADVTKAVMEKTFGLLGDGGGAEVVFGPALDGGYYLVGMRECHAAVFTGIPWSSSGTLEASVAAAAKAGLGVMLLDEELRDIDEVSDWEAWRRGRGE